MFEMTLKLSIYVHLEKTHNMQDDVSLLECFVDV